MTTTMRKAVPLADGGRELFEGDEPGGPSFENLGRRLVWLAERTLGEDLEDRLRRVQVHPNECGYDPFGFDPDTARYLFAIAAFLYRKYFRAEAHGIEKLPQGRMMLVSNHSGQIPIDGVMIGAALMLEGDPPRFARSMVEKWSAQLPFVSVFFPRCGQVVGAPENAKRLLERDETLLVFPEGVKGISKTYDRRYQLANFGLGFMRLALETKTPIVPVSVIGAEEQYISVADIKSVAKVFGMPSFPIVPQMFLGMPLPLPTKYRIYFGEPLVFEGDPDDDDAVIEQKVWTVRTSIQSMLNRGLQERAHVFF